MVLVALSTSELLAFVPAPVADFGVRFGLPRPVASCLAVFLLLGALYGVSFLSYSKAVDFLEDFPKYSRKVKDLGQKWQHKAEALRKTTEEIVPQSAEDKKAVTIKQSSSVSATVTYALGSVGEI